MAFSPDGTLLSAAGDRDFGLWKVSDPARPRSVKVDGFSLVSSDLTNMMAVAFSPDGATLAVSGLGSSNNGNLCLLGLSADRLSDYSNVTCAPIGFGILALAYLRGGALLSGGPDGVVRSWRSPMPLVADAQSPYLDSSWGFSDNGRLMLGAASTPSSSSIGVWDTSTSRRVATIKLSDAVQQAEFATKTSLLSVAHDGKIQLWDLRDPHHPVRGASLGTAGFPTVGNLIVGTGVVANEAGDLVTVQGNDRRVHIWHVTDAHHAAEVGSFPLSDPDNWSAIMPDGRTVLVATASGIEWWDTSDPQHPVRSGTTRLGNANRVSLGTDDDLVVVSTPQESSDFSGGNVVRLFRVSAGKVTASSRLQGAIGSEVNFSADNGVLAATGSGDSTVRFWDISDPRHPRLRASVRTTAGTRDVSFDQDGRMVAVHTMDEIQLWDIRDLAQPVHKATISSQDNSIRRTKFLRSGDTLAVARRDGIAFYSTDLAGLADRVCSYTGTSMSEDQWNEYALGIPYRAPCPSQDR